LRTVVSLYCCIVLGSLFANAQSESQRFSVPNTPALTQSAAAPAPTVQRVLVKLRALLAQAMEEALPLQSMALSQGVAKSGPINTFLGRYSARTLTPLYPNLVRIKKQQGLSDFQIATGIQQKFAKRGSRFQGTFQPPEISRTYVLELDSASGRDPQQILKELNADPEVEFAEPEHIYTTNQLPNDPYLSSTGTWGQTYQDLWGLYKINAPTAWNTTLGDGVIVAVVDTGIDYNHPDIAANIWINKGEIPNNGIDDDHNGYIDDVRGWDFTSNTNDPIDHFGHGTHVAGTIAAVGNNGIGVIGIAWHAQVMAVKGLSDFGFGDDTTLAPAITYAANNGADVINASWGGQGSSQTIEDAIKYAYSLGVIFVAAAGNSSQDALNFFPANSPEAITVSASDSSDALAYFSNFGSKVDVAAPGVDILSLQAAGTNLGPVVSSGYCRLSGTSMATPHVSGTAALVLSQNPTYSNEDVRQAIRASATDIGPPGWDTSFGYGRVNAAAALTLPDVLQVHITSPAAGTHVNSPVTISGSATGSNFDHYVLDYGVGLTPSTWTVLQTSTTPVVSGVLGTFDPSVLPDGTYTIRLTAFDKSNIAFADRIALVVQYAVITTPVPPDVPVKAVEFKPGVVVQIVGTATGATFKDFSLQWAEGINPSSGWSSTGMTLVGTGSAPITNGLLGTWDTSGIAKADYYTIRLMVDDSGNGNPFTNTVQTLVYLEPDLLSQNWPQLLAGGPHFQSGFVPVTDAAGNIRLGVLSPPTFFGSAPEFLSFTPDGSSVNVTPLLSAAYTNPAAGDMDGNPGEEAVFPDKDGIHILRSDGTSSTLQSGSLIVDFLSNQVVLEDVEGHSQLDAVVLGNDLLDPSLAHLFAWRRDGSLLNANFPISIPDSNYELRVIPSTPRTLVADINGDGYKEFLVLEGVSPSTFALGLFAHYGTPSGWAAPVMSGVPVAIALADLDHNGKLETILIQYPGSGSDGILHVFQPDGTERQGWPHVLTYGFNSGSIAVGDLDRNGSEEIVVSTSFYIYVFKADGSPFSNGWPLYTGSQFGKAVLADVDGDGYPEILVTESVAAIAPNGLLAAPVDASLTGEAALRTNLETQINADSRVRYVRTEAGSVSSTGTLYLTPRLLALHRKGNIAVRSWKMLGAAGNQPYYDATITTGDFNHDGITDIALTYFTISGGGLGGFLSQGVAMVLSTGTPYNPAVNDWPMLNHDPRNTALLRRSLSSNVALSADTNLSVYGQAVTLQAIVSAGKGTPVGWVDFKDGTTILGGGPVSNGIASFTTTLLSAGSHTLVASYSGGANFLPSSSAGFTLTVNKAPLTVTANNKTRLFGRGNPTLDGVVIGIQNGDNVYGVYTTTATHLSPIGTYVIQAAVASGGLHTLDNYSFTLYNGTLTVADRAITIQSFTTGHLRFQHIALMATVGGIGMTPTGTVTFKDGGNALTGGTGSLNSGSFTLDVSQLSLGKHTITVDYSGDGNYGAMTSDAFNFYRSPKPH